MESSDQENLTGLEIAVIGMACRFAHAKNIDEFWHYLKNGIEGISFFTHQELEQTGVDPQLLANPHYVKARGIAADIEYFDASFFGYVPIEAELMDPQVRIFHECVWEALEDGAYVPGEYRGRIGIYAGASAHLKWEILSLISGKLATLGHFASWQLYDKDFMSTRISYNLNLLGPSVNVQTACSTSLVAIHLACQGLVIGECHLALAGGITAAIPGKQGYLYEEGMISSSDGHCRTFDAKSNGTVSSEGAGVVLLKPLEAAIADRDFIYAVIKGSAVNNDGAGKVGYTAPSVKGQAAVIRSAHRAAGVSPETISYIEAHGTATNLGDPAEIEALIQAFKTKKKGFCRIGSVKSNLGHTDSAAGAAGFIKTVLALKHRLIPPTLYFKTPNPKIDFENSPFVVNTSLTQWKNDGYPLRAGVSSFGIGGTNAHVILEQAPETREKKGTRTITSLLHEENKKKYQLILLSAKTPSSLQQMTENLLEYLKKNPLANLADVGYTLKIGRKAFKHRKMIVSANTRETIEYLSPAHEAKVHEAAVERDNRPVAFMFSGQGSQYVNMGLDLYRTEPLFREEMDHCFEILDKRLDYDIKEILYPSTRDNRPNTSNKSYKSHINQTEIAQPLLFIIEYALARLLMHWGIKPYAMIGHSIGEYVAACLSGVFSLQDALEIVVLRGQLMQKLPPGDMLSVSLSPEELSPLLASPGFTGEISIAAINTPSRCVVSGPGPAIARVAKELEEKGYENRILHTSHAFHSEMMAPLLTEFQEKISQIPLNKPLIPYISNVTGAWIISQDARNPAYWAKHLRLTVKFSHGLAELLKNPELVLVEVGPGKTLTTFARQHPGKKDTHMIYDILRHPEKNEPDDFFLLNKIGQLWLCGVKIDWKTFYANEERYRIPLPTYPFERQHYPIAGNPFAMGAEMLKKETASLEKNPDLSRWFYIPIWEKSFSPLSPQTQPGGAAAVFNWLVFSDQQGLGTRLIEKLKQQGQQVVIVNPGPGFTRKSDREFIVNPQQENDYENLFKELQKMEQVPHKIIHLWNVTGNMEKPSGFELMDRILDTGFYSLLNIARTLGKLRITGKMQIGVITDNMQDVLGIEELCPEKATLLGAVKVISAEYPNLRCGSMDIQHHTPGGTLEAKLLNQLLQEFLSEIPDQVIAFRGAHRWIQVIKPVPFNTPENKTPLLKEKGVYLVTGGLGGIGLTLAGYLAESVNARLVLTSRSPFPPREEWQNWLSSHDGLHRTSIKIKSLLEIENQGGEVLVLQADAANLEQMQRVIDLTRQRFGPINGIIHSAGLPDGGVIQIRTREMTEQIFDAKLRGTLVLDHIFKDRPLDLFVLCSSLSSILAPFGQVAYSAANAFLDTYALYKTRVDQTGFTAAIDWDAWQEVGMAVEAARKITRRETAPLPSPELAAGVTHPLFDYRMQTNSDETTYVSRLARDKHWILNEHRILGKPTLPGTACVEMARAALEDHTGNASIEVSEIYFLTPLRIEGVEEKEVHTRLKNQGDHYTFVINSRLHPGANSWSEHARGKLRVEEEPWPVKKHNIKEIKTKCHQDAIIVTKEMLAAKPALDELNFEFGPRWKNVKEIYFGPQQVLLLLELAEEFTGDIGIYQLHPALLDTAAGLYSGKDTRVKPSLPFSYKKVKIKAPFTRRLYSFQEYAPQTQEGEKMVKYSITIMDEQGVELVNIREYRRLTVSDTAKNRLTREVSQARGENPLSPNEPDYRELLRHGLLPTEGIEVFRRILARGLPHVVISTGDFASRQEASQGLQDSSLSDEWKPAKSREALRPRPGMSKAYAAPTNKIETEIAQLWQDFLGIEEVGIHDDFFELGGDSLKVLTITSIIHKNMNVEVPMGEFFNNPTIVGISSYINHLKKSGYTGIEPVEKKEYYPLSSAQKRLYVLQQMDANSTFYNLPDIMIIEGKIEKEKLEKTFNRLINNHEILRTSFKFVQGKIVQFIQDELDFKIDFSETNGKDTDEVIKNYIKPFDLGKAPLLRVGLIKIKIKTHILILDIHHIINDGTSHEIFKKEFMALYDQKELPRLKIQYKDYSVWQNHEIRKELLRKQEEYWMKRFEGEISGLNLPTDWERPVQQSSEGSILRFTINKDLTAKIRKIALETETTLYMLLIAVYNVLFFKYSGQEDIIVGSPITGRTHADTQDLIGLFVNVLLMRNSPKPNKSFREFLTEVKENSLKGYENQDYQFDELVSKLGLQRNHNRSPLCNTAFTMQNQDKTALDQQVLTSTGEGASALKMQPYTFDHDISKYDLTLDAVEVQDFLNFWFTYSSQLFKLSTIEKIKNHYIEILEQIVENINIKLKDIALSSRLVAAKADLIREDDRDFAF